MPALHREQDDRLGQWVSVQRRHKDMMSPERCQRLDTLGFVWDPFTAQWEEGFAELQRYHHREGHCRVPERHREQGIRLGLWVAVQRRTKIGRASCRERV